MLISLQDSRLVSVGNCLHPETFSQVMYRLMYTCAHAYAYVHILIQKIPTALPSQTGCTCEKGAAYLLEQLNFTDYIAYSHR